MSSRSTVFVRRLGAYAGAALFAAGLAGCHQAAKPVIKPTATAKAKTPAVQAPVVDVAAQRPIAPCSTTTTSPNLPPANSPPLTACYEMRFHPSDEPMVDFETYSYYLKVAKHFSVPSKNLWEPFDEDMLADDFQSLWKTNFLDNLWIEVIDEPYSNGVLGKHVIFHVEERSKLKGVDYTGSKEVTVSKIDEKLREKAIGLKLDSFVDQATIRRVVGVVRDLYAEKGFEDPKITTTMTPVAGGPRLVQLTIDVQEGPKIRIRQVVFDGNKAFRDNTLAEQMKGNRASNVLSFVTGSGEYQEAKFADDAQAITDFYREHGYMRVQVGTPQLERLTDSKDGRTRWVRLRVPVDEGPRYRMGKLTVPDKLIIQEGFIETRFPVRPGEWINWKKVGKAIEQLRDLYSGIGYIYAQPDPVLTFNDFDVKTGQPIDIGAAKPTADIAMHIAEGKQFRVNRIEITGNTTTHDTVARREMHVREGDFFSMEALKLSIRRLNQLGYFKPIESEDAVKIEEVPGDDSRLNVKLKFEEQNRNQISFGAGASALDGFFGQLSFQTSNFLGRGETLGITLQKGSQARNYQVSFTEPYLFDRPITAGLEGFSRTLLYPGLYTQLSTGGSVIAGLPISNFTRLYFGYTYVVDKVLDINPLYLLPGTLAGNPLLAESLLINEGGKRTTGKVSPSIVFDTVNQPIFPDQGMRLTAGADVAGIGGDVQYWSARLEGIFYHRLPGRTSFGLRAQAQYITPYGSSDAIPIFQKIFLGGEYSIRGFDLRTIGPRDPTSGIVTGGNKSVLFNAEYVLNVGGPIRVLAFYDAGQVRDVNQPFRLYDSLVKVVPPTPPPLSLPLDPTPLIDPNNPPAVSTIETVGRVSAFKTSVGMEVRFFMPVLNVPFRLIFAFNPQRAGVLDQNLQLTKRFTIRFAVGTTF